MPKRPAMCLDVYLLGRLPLADLLTLQRRLVYDISGEADRAALVLCEHEPALTIGRGGSEADIDADLIDLRRRGWDVRRVNRGGGCLAHLPGQVAAYPVFPLDRLGLTLGGYLARLESLAVQLTDGFAVTVADREVCHVGVAVRQAVSYFGLTVNVRPDLAPFHAVRCGGRPRPMTSLERELRLPISPAAVRQKLIELFEVGFGFGSTVVLHHHPTLPRRARTHAVAHGIDA